MSDIIVNTDDIKRLAAKYANVGPIVQQETTKGVTRSVIAIEGDAKRLAPVDRGQLRRSLTHEVKASGRDVVGTAGTNLLYARFVEEGRRPGKMPPIAAIAGWASRHGIEPDAAFLIARSIGRRGTKPRPYLKPAFEKNRALINRELGPVLLRRISDRLAAR